MRNYIVAIMLVLVLGLAVSGCGRKAADPDARLRTEIGRYGLPEVISRAREAATKQPTAANFDYLARTYALGKQPQLGRQALEKAVSLDPTYAPSALLLGRALLQEEKAAAAEQMMRTLLAKQPDVDQAVELLCRSLLKQNKTAEALTTVEEAIKRNGNSVPLLWARADTQAILKEFDKSLKDYRAAMKLEPKNVAMRMSYVQTLVVSGKKDEGAQVAVETVALAPNSADVRFMAGSALHQAGKFDEALAQYKEALVINPAMVPAANNLALLLADRNQDTGTAVSWARKAAVLAPRSLAIADTLGWALARDGQLTDALPILREVNKTWQSNPTIWYHYGWALAKSGQKAAGLKLIQQAASSGSDCAAEAQKALREFS